MKALVSFAAVAVAVVAVVAAVNWWIDPLGQFWDTEVLEIAAEHGCVVSDDLVGTASWLPFKEDVFTMRRPQRVVVGTSRVLKLGGEDDLANLGMPGTGIETLRPLFRRLHELEPRPLTVYLGVDLFWLNRTWQPNVVFDRGLRRDARYLLARQTLSATARLVRVAPGTALHAWELEQPASLPCLVDRGARLLDGERDGWRADGSFVYRHELQGSGPVDSDEFERDLVAFAGPYYSRWERVDEARLAELGRALSLARSYGWRVVGFTSPYSSRYRARLTSAPETSRQVARLARALPSAFRAHGFPYVDWREFPCADDEYVDDGWHPDDRCAAKVLAALEDADVPG